MILPVFKVRLIKLVFSLNSRIFLNSGDLTFSYTNIYKFLSTLLALNRLYLVSTHLCTCLDTTVNYSLNYLLLSSLSVRS